MKKTKLCKMQKLVKVEDELELFIKRTTPAKFICLSCVRVAKKEKYLCKPYKI